MECLQVAGLTALLSLQSNIVSCQQIQTPAPTAPISVLELDVLGFRVWMIIGFVGIGFLIIIIVLCCIFDCRIPRTKQQIEQDQERRELIAKYKQKVKAMQYKKSKYTQARQRAAMMIGDWNIDDGETGTGTDAAPGTSGTADPVPLAQHPAALLTGSQEGGSNVSNKPLVMIPLIPGPPAIRFPNKMAFMRYYGFKTRKCRDGQNTGLHGPGRRAAQHGGMRREQLLQGRSRRQGAAPQVVSRSGRQVSSRAQRDAPYSTSRVYRNSPGSANVIELDRNMYRGRYVRETTA